MNKNSKIYIALWVFVSISLLSIIGCMTVNTDPFFHFHAPDTASYFYTLDNQRSQNDGIMKHFDYQGLITGTSMTENFRTSEAEDLFGVTFIKVPFEGASFKEIDNNIRTALEANDNLKIIIRGLDMRMFLEDKDYMREDLGTYPTYLYDDNIFNDVRYLFNRDVFFTRIYPMIKDKSNKGITSFDEYSNWMGGYTFGLKTIYPDGVAYEPFPDQEEITDQERMRVLESVRQNITSLADEYPNTTFYYFFTPYSVAWWKYQIDTGNFDKQTEAERIVIAEILNHDNIMLFSFNDEATITTDLNNYKDDLHYGEWINTLILKYMKEGHDRLTKDNYERYLSREKELYMTFDYMELNKQIDYDNDYDAANIALR